jgi:His Kinase A (phospho-acceptor) domain
MLGEGLPGLAWAKGQPLLLEDIRDTGRFDRAIAAQRAGVREAMAVPVTGADGVVAVLELFVTHERAGEPGRLGRIARVAGELPIELSIGAWSGPEGIAFSGVLRDITERKRAEAELATANRELERANAELETLVYSASHDLKSPMVSLLGYLEYLRLDYGEALGPEGGRYLDRMVDSTMYMQQLIHDLIDLSRVGRSGVEPIEVDPARERRPPRRHPARAPRARLRGLRAPGEPLLQRRDGHGAGHLPQDRRGPGGRHRHRGRPRDRRPDRAPGGRRRPLAVPRADRRGAPVRSLRVLLVEDDPDHVFLVRRAPGLLRAPRGPRGGRGQGGDLVRVQADRRPPLPLRGPAAR